jgi:hypothetical protein
MLGQIVDIADTDGVCLFDQLAEEVMELHLAYRGRHKDPPLMEWIEIATIAISAIRMWPSVEVNEQFNRWLERHGH